jgi:hypothetical protein
VEQIKRVIANLNGSVLNYTLPFRGRATELLCPEKEELEIDFAEQKSRTCLSFEAFE